MVYVDGLVPTRPTPEEAALRAFLTETVDGMLAEAVRVPRTPANVAVLAEIGATISGLEALKSKLLPTR